MLGGFPSQKLSCRWVWILPPPKALQIWMTILPLWDPESRANYLSQDVKVGKSGAERPTAITLHQPSNFTATSRPAKFFGDKNKLYPVKIFIFPGEV